MNPQLALSAAVIFPLAGAFVLPLAGSFSARLRNILAFVCVAVPFACSCALVPQALGGSPATISYAFPFGLDLILTADGLAVFMALVSSLISAIIVLYSFGYISHYENQDEYYFMVVLFLGAMMGLVFSANLILLYLFWEITAITSWRLIGFFRKPEYRLKADKSFMVTVFGALVMLLGFVAIYQQTGTFDMRHAQLPGFVVALVLFGILSKSATLPFHTWLPDAGVAPSPVTALLHAAILVKIGLYVFARLFVATYSIDAFWSTAVPVIAAISSLVSAGAALVETDLKRIIAYSTVSQIGFIFFGLSIGNETGVVAGLLYIMAHGFAKAGLFLCAGIVEQNTKVRDITKLGGLIKTMPVTAVAFLLCAFSVMGIPPFSGFFAKYLVFSGAVKGGQLAIAGVFLAGAVMTIMYLLRVFHRVFIAEPAPQAETAGYIRALEGDRMMVFSVALLAVLALATGVLIGWIFPLTQNAVAFMMAAR